MRNGRSVQGIGTAAFLHGFFEGGVGIELSIYGKRESGFSNDFLDNRKSSKDGDLLQYTLNLFCLVLYLPISPHPDLGMPKPKPQLPIYALMAAIVVLLQFSEPCVTKTRKNFATQSFVEMSLTLATAIDSVAATAFSLPATFVFSSSSSFSSFFFSYNSSSFPHTKRINQHYTSFQVEIRWCIWSDTAKKRLGRSRHQNCSLEACPTVVVTINNLMLLLNHSGIPPLLLLLLLLLPNPTRVLKLGPFTQLNDRSAFRYVFNGKWLW
ncbi:hypothetical protein Gotur_003100 [Gossypium turneri]